MASSLIPLPPAFPAASGSGSPERPVKAVPAGTDDLALSRTFANLLDRAIAVRGSRVRIGLDPLLGLIPGVGDALAAAAGSIIVLEAMRLNAPRGLVLRMAANLGVNAVLGAIPIAGDIFSFLFQSNVRNYALLHAWRTGTAPERTVSRGKLWGGCAALLLVTAGLIALMWWVVTALWRWMMHS